VARGRTDAIIAGVNKAGTTSLFVSLSAHPDVAPSSIKETRYFLPARYGQSLPPIEEWDAYFADAGDRPVHLEATPSYFYGGAAVAEAMRSRLVDPRALVVLREPVSRALSFFSYQKIRLRFPADYPIADYLAAILFFPTLPGGPVQSTTPLAAWAASRWARPSWSSSRSS